MWENDNKNSYNSKYNSLIIKYIIQFDTSKLNRRNHYNEYQKKLFDEVKYLKDVYKDILIKFFKPSRFVLLLLVLAA